MPAGWKVNPLVLAAVIDVPEFGGGVVNRVAVVGVRSRGWGGEDEGVNGDFGEQDAAVSWDGDDPDEVVVAVVGGDVKGELVGVEPEVAFADGGSGYWCRPRNSRWAG